MPIRSGWGITITPEPILFANMFFAMAERARELQIPMREEIVPRAAEEIAANFAAQGRPAPWKGLAAATIAKRGTSGPILDESGALRSAASSPDAWVVQSGGQTTTAVLTNTTPYGGFHVTGTEFMPVRDWTYLPGEFADFGAEAIASYIMAAAELKA